ncbi:MAG: stage II sporulation protein R [Bacillota bacterium]|jgi:stage II sporulation protein R
MRRYFVFVGLLLLAGVFWLDIGVCAAGELPPPLIRLHVSANGESLREQQVKMQVRDDLLAYLNPLLAGVADPEEAVSRLRAHLGQLSQIARQTLEDQGEDYQASLQLGEFNFPAKHYGTFTLPAGRYQALNVTLGTGEGRNWWCVVFPPMCLTSGVCQPLGQTEPQTLVLRSLLWDCWQSLRDRFVTASFRQVVVAQPPSA